MTNKSGKRTDGPNRNQEHKLHLQHLKKMAIKLCNHFGISPDCFAVSSYLFRRNGPDNTSAIYLWLNDRYGSEDNWGSPLDIDDCAKMLREDLIKHIPDHYLGDILM